MARHAVAHSIPMHALQRADKRLGWLACALLQPLRLRRAPRPEPHEARNVLLIKFWGIGSLQLLTPATRALRRRHPNAALTLLTLRQNVEFADGLGVFDEVLPLDVEGGGWREILGRILRLVLDLRERRVDVVYDFEFFTRFSAVISILTGASETAGFAAPTVWRGRFHTRTVPFNRYWHVSRNFRCLAGGENGLEIEAADVVPFGWRPEHSFELERVLREQRFGEDGLLVVLNPNAGSLSLERRWPQTYFAQLARRLVLEQGARVALIGSASERAWTSEVAAIAGELPAGRLANLAGELSLGALHALFARAGAVVSNDSGPMHLAAASGAPTLGLFGPETPVMYAPLGARARALYRPPACSPCINVHDNKVVACFRGRPECLIGIGVDDVLEETLALAARHRLRVVEVPSAPRTAAPQPRAARGAQGTVR